MASIYKRINTDGTFSYRIQIRRKGFKKFSSTFSSQIEAEMFAKEYEEKYIFDENFNFDQLLRRRKNEFARN